MKIKKSSVLLVLAGLMAWTIGVNAAAPNVDLYVSAAASLKDVLTEAQTNYQKRHPEVKLYYNLAASGVLQTQIEQGAPADLFVSAAPKQMNALEQKGLIQKTTRRDLVKNQLVLVIPKNAKTTIKTFNDLSLDKVKKIAIGAPESVPAGMYAQEVFKNLRIADKLQGKLVLGSNVRTVLSYVETGNVDAGIVYRTDAITSDQVKIVAVAPQSSHEAIIYPAAVLKGAKQSKAAAGFLAYLAGADGKILFKKYGFIAVN